MRLRTATRMPPRTAMPRTMEQRTDSPSLRSNRRTRRSPDRPAGSGPGSASACFLLQEVRRRHRRMARSPTRHGGRHGTAWWRAPLGRRMPTAKTTGPTGGSPRDPKVRTGAYSPAASDSHPSRPRPQADVTVRRARSALSLGPEPVSAPRARGGAGLRSRSGAPPRGGPSRRRRRPAPVPCRSARDAAAGRS